MEYEVRFYYPSSEVNNLLDKLSELKELEKKPRTYEKTVQYNHSDSRYDFYSKEIDGRFRLRLSSWGPEEMVRRLSRQKAQDVAERYTEDCIIVGADTVVSCDQEILGKPANDQDAFRMLHMLQGRTHEVYTGVTVIEGSVDVRKETVFAEKTEVTMYPMTDKMIWDYIRTGEPADKAGAYGIQGRAAVFIRSIHGDYNNVVGLPVAALWQYLNSGKEENDATL